MEEHQPELMLFRERVTSAGEHGVLEQKEAGAFYHGAIRFEERAVKVPGASLVAFGHDRMRA